MAERYYANTRLETITRLPRVAVNSFENQGVETLADLSRFLEHHKLNCIRGVGKLSEDVLREALVSARLWSG